MRSTASELNWSGTVTYSAERVVRPRHVDEVAEVVAGAERVHGLGTRHSFNDVADTAGVLLDLTGLPTDLVVDADRGEVTLGAGTRYGDVAPEIDQAGFALHNMGSLPHISVGGATATGTHGSGTALGSLSSAVTALEVVGPDGTTRTVRLGDDDHLGSVLHLGLLGIVTRVTLAVEPAYRMRQDQYGSFAFDDLADHAAEVFASGTSVSVFTDFDDVVRDALVKTRVPADADDVAVPDDLLGAPRRSPRRAPRGPSGGGDERGTTPDGRGTTPDGRGTTPDGRGTTREERGTTRDGSVGPWWDRLPHFRIDAVPSVGSEVQSEHFVPLRHAAGALRAVQRLGERIRPHLHVSELRTQAADPFWLSPTQGEDVLCIAFTWKKHPVEVQALLPDLEAALAPFGGRPHWGKMSSLDADAVAALYPQLPAFRELVARVDPGRTFSSAFGERVLGV